MRDIEPTEAEWFTAIDFLTRTGKLCTDKRQEFILLSDTLGVSMLVDAINHRLSNKATPTTVTGPFHIDNSPEVEHGAKHGRRCAGHSVLRAGQSALISTGKPIGNVKLDIWQTDGEGLYEAQVEDTEDYMRGIYHSQAGRHISNPDSRADWLHHSARWHCRRAVLTHQHQPLRPAHIHFMIESPGFHKVTTHLFQKGDQYIETDVVYGVKEPLIVEFQKKGAGEKAPNGEVMKKPFYVVNYDFTLQKLAQAKAA